MLLLFIIKIFLEDIFGTTRRYTSLYKPYIYVFTLLEIKIQNVVQNSSFLWTFVGNGSDVLIV
jgi:hypothetical protein